MTDRHEAAELEHDAIGFREALSVGLASTAPAYSLAAVIGTVTVLVGFQAPGALLVSFVPMFLIPYKLVHRATVPVLVVPEEGA